MRPRPMHIVRLDNGDNASSPFKASQTWERFSTSKLGAVVESKEDLFSSYVLTETKKKQSEEPIQLDFKSVPTVVGTEKTMRAGKA